MPEQIALSADDIYDDGSPDYRFLQKQNIKTAWCADKYKELALNVLLCGSGIGLLVWAESSLSESFTRWIGIFLFNAGFIPFWFFQFDLIGDLFFLCGCGERTGTWAGHFKKIGTVLISVGLATFLLAENQHDTVEDWAQMIGSRMIMVCSLFIMQWFFGPQSESQQCVGTAVAKTYFNNFLKPFCDSLQSQMPFTFEREMQGIYTCTPPIGRYKLKGDYKLIVLIPKKLSSDKDNIRDALVGTQTAIGYPTHRRMNTMFVRVLRTEKEKGQRYCSDLINLPTVLSAIYHQTNGDASGEQMKHFQKTLFKLIENDPKLRKVVMLLQIPEIKGASVDIGAIKLEIKGWRLSVGD